MERSSSYRRRSRSPIRRDDRRTRDRFRTSRSQSPAQRRGSYRSRSPVGNRKGHGSNRMNPSPSRVLGIFGLSVHTTEGQVRQIFTKFGPIDKLQLVYDTKTGRSRGFCFVYYQNTEDAKAAKDQCTGMEIDRQRIRVDFSLTARPHSPTPGCYMGRSTRRSDDGEGGGGGGRKERDSDYFNHNSSDPPPYRRRRSPSPQYRRRRNRSASYSPPIRTR